MSHDEVIAANTFFWAVACGLSALVAPWIALIFNRWAASAGAGVLALAGTILYSACSSHIPSSVNIRADVVIMFPLLLVAWLECIGLAFFAALKKPRKSV